MAGFFERIKSVLGGDSAGSAEDGHSSRASEPLLSEEELARIGTEEDLLRDYETSSERNFQAMEAEQNGDVKLAISLYRQSVDEEFVESHPYERLAILHERRGEKPEALAVTRKFIDLAKSGRMPRGAQRSADRKLESFQTRAERLRDASNSRDPRNK